MSEPGDSTKKVVKGGSVATLLLALAMLGFAALVLMLLGPKLEDIRADFDTQPEGIVALILSVSPMQWALSALGCGAFLVVKEIILPAGIVSYLLNLLGMLYAVAVLLAYVVATYGALVQLVMSLTA